MKSIDALFLMNSSPLVEFSAVYTSPEEATYISFDERGPDYIIFSLISDRYFILKTFNNF